MQVQLVRAVPAKDTDEITALQSCCLFSLLSLPTKLADGLGLRDTLLLEEAKNKKQKHTSTFCSFYLRYAPYFGSSAPTYAMQFIGLG
jgi:hypothetical protein